MTDLPTAGRPAERLASDAIAWLTTIGSNGAPQSSPVWFVTHDGAIYLRSQSEAAKVRNVVAHPAVSFHLESDGSGGDIVTIEGKADVLDGAPDALLDVYLAKYDTVIRERMGTTPEDLAREYSTTIRISPTRIRAW
jgi:PPOX class probable F420-dependent enzyme